MQRKSRSNFRHVDGRDRFPSSRLQPTEVMHFAMSAQLESAPLRGLVVSRTGRQALADSMGISLARLSSLATGTPDQLAELAVAIEQYGYAEPATLTRLSEQIRLGPDRWAIDQRWWPQVRDHHGLGEAPRFFVPAQVTLAAEAFAAYYQHVIAGGDTPRRLGGRDLAAAGQLIDLLCRLSCGPYGVTHDALKMLAKLAPLDPGRVMEFARRGGRWSEVIRALDRASADTKRNWKSRNEMATLLATPPPWLFRQTYWLRAIRRLRLTDFASGSGSGAKEWIPGQMEIAIRGDKSYAGSDLPTRRYALWCAAELTLDDDRWRRIARLAADDPGISPILADAEKMRSWLAARPLHHRDGFFFTPTDGWSLDRSPPEVCEALDPGSVEAKTWSQYKVWKWARPSTRRQAILLLRDAIASPCAVRYRSACDALSAAGSVARECAVTTVIDVIEAEQASSRPDSALQQRGLRVLGQLDGVRAIEVVEHTIRNTQDNDEVLFDALLSAGDLARSHPHESVGMMAWVTNRLGRQAAVERLAIGAIYAQVSFRRRPDEWVAADAPDTLAVRSMREWGTEVLADPLLARST